MIQETNFERYLNEISGKKFTVIFDSLSIQGKKKSIDVIMFKKGGSIKENSITIPSFYIMWAEYKNGKPESVKYKSKEYNSFDTALRAFEKLYEAQLNKEGVIVSRKISEYARDIWKQKFDDKFIFRSEHINNVLLNNIINALYNVSNQLDVEVQGATDKDILFIINKVNSIKTSINKVDNPTLYKSSVDVFHFLYRKWKAIASKLKDSTVLYGEVKVSNSDHTVVDEATKQFAIYNNYLFA